MVLCKGCRHLSLFVCITGYADNPIILSYICRANYNIDYYLQLYLEDGRIKVELITPNNPKVNLDNYQERFNDGRWHTVVLTISTNSLILSVDYRPMKTVRYLKMFTGGIYMVAGTIIL